MLSTLGITTNAVVRDEMASITAQVVSTASRAEDTPVSKDTTTNTFSGTRNKADSYVQVSVLNHTSPMKGAHRRTMLVRNQRTTKHALHWVIHPDTSLEQTKRPKFEVFASFAFPVPNTNARRECDCRCCTNES